MQKEAIGCQEEGALDLSVGSKLERACQNISATISFETSSERAMPDIVKCKCVGRQCEGSKVRLPLPVVSSEFEGQTSRPATISRIASHIELPFLSKIVIASCPCKS